MCAGNSPCLLSSVRPRESQPDAALFDETVGTPRAPGAWPERTRRKEFLFFLARLFAMSFAYPEPGEGKSAGGVWRWDADDTELAL